MLHALPSIIMMPLFLDRASDAGLRKHCQQTVSRVAMTVFPSQTASRWG
jgi:hypothetical protein